MGADKATLVEDDSLARVLTSWMENMRAIGIDATIRRVKPWAVINAAGERTLTLAGNARLRMVPGRLRMP